MMTTTNTFDTPTDPNNSYVPLLSTKKFMEFKNRKKKEELSNKNKFNLFEGQLRDVKLEKHMKTLNDGDYENSFDNIEIDDVKNKKEVKKLNEFDNE